MRARGDRGAIRPGRDTAGAGIRLADCKRGDRLKILAIDAGRGATLSLMGMGLGIGHELELLRLSPLGGPLLVLRGETKVAIGYGMAKKILVEKSG